MQHLYAQEIPVIQAGFMQYPGYAKPSEADGFRVLANRLCPRGWPDFVERYQEGLKTESKWLAVVADKARHGTVTVLFAGRDETHNEAVVQRGPVFVINVAESFPAYENKV